MGATGSFSMVVSHIAGIQQGVLIFAGSMIMIMALAMSGWLPIWKMFGDYYNPNGCLVRGFNKLTRPNSVASYFPVGLLLGLLPCDPVYTALLAAAGAGMDATSTVEGIYRGMGVMFFFGLGTVPALFLIAKLVNMGWLKNRQFIYRMGTILMLIVGAYFIYLAVR